jgi:phosphate transport system substrate-binding protein
MSRIKGCCPGLTLAAVIFALMFFLEGSVTAGPLLFSGSSTMQKRVLEPVQKQLEKKTGVMIDVLGAGTIRGIKDLMAGSAGAAIADCPLALAFQETGIPTEGTYREHVISSDSIVAIVNPKNAVKKLTTEQLADIHSGKISNWKDVGGPNDRIVVVIPPSSSGTRSVIEDSLMGGAAFAAGAYVTVTDREALDIVAKSPIAIALLSEGFARIHGAKVKILKTPPLKRQLCIITKNDPSEDLKKVIKFLQSKEAKKLFQ